MDSVILFDGCCGMCSRSARLISKLDRHRRFRFLSLRTEPGRELVRQCGEDPDDPHTLLLIEKNRCFRKSDAVLAIGGRIEGLHYFASALRMIPRPIRDWSYDIIARNRHRLTWETKTCALSPHDEPIHDANPRSESPEARAGD